MLTLVSCAVLALSQSPSPSHIKSVTVYPDRAEVTREVSLHVNSGPQEILIGPLPIELDDSSLRVSGMSAGRAASALSLGDIEVRRQPGIEVRGPELDTAEALLSGLEQTATALDDRMARIVKLRELLGSLQGASATQFAREMASTQLKPETWQGAYEFLKKNLDDLSAEERKARLDRADLAAKIDVARSSVAMLKSRRTLEHKLLAVTVEAAAASDLNLEVSYAQPGAFWAPTYEAVMDPGTGTVTLRMFAWVKQTTGETWDGVKLTLATGAPSLGIDLPRLASMTLGPIPLRLEASNMTGQELKKDIDEVEVITSGASAEFSRADGGFADTPGAREKALGPQTPVNVVQKLASFAQADTVTTFQVPGTVSLSPDGQPRRVSVSRVTLPGRREYLVIPSVRPAAFLLERVTVAPDHPLLAGVVKHYVGSTLVGSSTIPAVAPGEELVLSFGADDRVKVEVPALPPTTSDRGSNRLSTYDRRVSITNRTGQAIDVKVKERVPVSTSDAIKVSLSDDTTQGFETKETEPGIYTWSLSLAADAKRDIVLGYTVRHPASMVLAVMR